MNRLAVAMMTVLMFVGNSASAQISDGDQIFKVGLGATIPGFSQTDLGQLAKPGMMADIQYVYHIRPELGFGGEYSYHGFSESVFYTTAADFTSAMAISVFEGVIRYVLFPKMRASPYAVAGLGLSLVSLEMKGTPNAGYLWTDTGTREERVVFSGNSTGVASSIGIGIDGVIYEHTVLGAEVRWRYLNGGTMNGSSQIAGMPTQVPLSNNWALTLGEAGLEVLIQHSVLLGHCA